MMTDSVKKTVYPLLAAIDLGTNACRLLIVRPVEDEGGMSLETVEAFSRSIRLGGTLGMTGKLSPQAMDRALEVLIQCAEKLKRHEGEKIVLRCVATAACRKALNCREFMQRIHERTGLSFEVISVDEEARLAVLGCHDLFDLEKSHAIVFDIGGGSSEVIWVDLAVADNPRVIDWVSLPYGVVTIGDALQRQNVWGTYLSSMKQFVSKKVSAFVEQHGIIDHMQQGRVHMVGTSGTLTTFAAIDQGLVHYDRSQIHGVHLSQKKLNDLLDMLFKLSPNERLAHPCIGPGRADLVMAGAAIFHGIYDVIPADEVCVADRGVRDGVLFDLLDKIHAS